MENPNEKKLEKELSEKELSEKELEKVSGGSAAGGSGGGKASSPTVLDMDAASPKLY
jgi:bacteriocin-like protein